jgi:RNA polymerase sigma factor (sigma-70 family)
MSMHLPPFQQLIDAHAAELHRFLTGCVGRTDADDCLQETLLSALRAYPRLTRADNLRGWLFTIAHRKATDAARRRARQRADALDGVDPAVAPQRLDDDELWGAVRALPAKQRAAVVHRYVFDLAYRDIGERMGISEEAARQNVSAGLRRLRLEVSP